MTGVEGVFTATCPIVVEPLRKEKPDKKLNLLTDHGSVTSGDLVNVGTRSSIAAVDKYFTQVQTRAQRQTPFSRCRQSVKCERK